MKYLASILIMLGFVMLSVAASWGCSSGDKVGGSASQQRCKQAVNRSGASVQVCCNDGEAIVEASMCTYGGFIASCARTNDNCIERTNDGQYAVNCWSENCKDCPSAPSYDVLITWCANN